MRPVCGPPAERHQLCTATPAAPTRCRRRVGLSRRPTLVTYARTRPGPSRCHCVLQRVARSKRNNNNNPSMAWQYIWFLWRHVTKIIYASILGACVLTQHQPLLPVLHLRHRRQAPLAAHAQCARAPAAALRRYQ
eukprot:scaffold47014_cov61-Phaeocystis_antarctica.AAC.1